MDFSPLKSLGVGVELNMPLGKWTTFQLGGPCQVCFSCATPLHLEVTLNFLMTEKMPYILIGGGSNLVISDEGVNCAVVRYFSEEPAITRVRDEIHVSGSTILDHLALYAAQQGLEGLNYTSGIPGTVGGAIVGNAGAFGKQVGDALKSVTLLSPAGQQYEATATELGFSYRNSRLKESGDIVVCAVFKVCPSEKSVLLKERAEFLKLRMEKHPDLQKYPCAGSFFRNVEPTSKAERRQATGWFLEQAGGKELSSGGAYIFAKHANIIVKGEHCRAQDVYELSLKMADLVKKTYHLDLVREVRFVGRLQGIAESDKNVIW